MIDSHCHLTDPRLQSQLTDVLHRAAGAGVARMITIGTSLADARAAIAICHDHENVRCAIGIHPNYCGEANIEDVNAIVELQNDPAVVALGEMGLDYHYDFSDRARQREFFSSTASRPAAESPGRHSQSRGDG